MGGSFGSHLLLLYSKKKILKNINSFSNSRHRSASRVSREKTISLSSREDFDKSFLNLLLINDFSAAKVLCERFSRKSKISLVRQIAQARLAYLEGRLSDAKSFLSKARLRENLSVAVDYCFLHDSSLRIADYVEADQAIIEGLQRFPGYIEIKISALKYQVMRAWRDPRHRDLALQNLTNLLATGIDARYLPDLAFIAAGVGHWLQAFKFLEEHITLAAKAPKRQEHKVAFSEEDTLASLLDLLDLISTQGLQAFPVFGSLLGLHREGALLKHDKDADIGIIIEGDDVLETIFRLTKRVCQEDRFFIPGLALDSPEAVKLNLAVYDASRGSSVDLFFFYKHSDGYVCGFDLHGKKLHWFFKELNLRATRAYGPEILVPGDVPSHLSKVYGDNWAVPDTLWDSLISSFNLTADSSDVSTLFALQRLSRAVELRNYAKVSYYCSELKRVWSYNFSQRTADALHPFLVQGHDKLHG